jgi:hypothetical protein
MSKGTRTAPPTTRPSDEAIAKRAYELFLQRGSVAGHEMDDWLEAEAELMLALERPTSTATRLDAAGPPPPAERRPARDRGAARRLVRPHPGQ